MQVGMGWGEWTIQVEHSSTGDRGWLHGWIHCIRPFVCVPQFELRFVMVRVGYGGVMVCHGHEGVALEYMQMGMGWGEWASQVEHSSRGEQGCMWACTSIRVRSADRIAVRVRYGGVTVRHGHGRGCLGVHAGGDGVG